ncbi:hypothetical protein HDU83_002395 [Entophlyctis luteolus]|nr:hypothetical protein HDU83_002395 [Entophlyctis luteolus]KAJ3386456.1 hypothetical protein HDU84_001530 [Entophlyctis sp. JEL0112]
MSTTTTPAAVTAATEQLDQATTVTTTTTTKTTVVTRSADSEDEHSAKDPASKEGKHQHHEHHHHEHHTFKEEIQIVETKVKHEEHEMHVFEKHLVQDVKTDKVAYETDGAAIVKGSVSIASGDVMGAIQVVEGGLKMIGALTKDAAEAFVQMKEEEDPAAAAKSKAVKAAETVEKVIDNIAKDVDPLAKGIQEIVKGDIVGGAEALAQEAAQIGADIAVPVVDAVSPNSVLSRTVDKLAPEIVADVGVVATSVGGIVQHKVVAGVDSLLDSAIQVQGEVSGAIASAKAVPAAAAAAVAAAATAAAAPAVVIPSVVASSAVVIATGDTLKTTHDIVDITSSILGVVDKVKTNYGSTSATTQEVEKLAVLMLRQLMTAAYK